MSSLLNNRQQWPPPATLSRRSHGLTRTRCLGLRIRRRGVPSRRVPLRRRALRDRRGPDPHVRLPLRRLPETNRLGLLRRRLLPPRRRHSNRPLQNPPPHRRIGPLARNNLLHRMRVPRRHARATVPGDRCNGRDVRRRAVVRGQQTRVDGEQDALGGAAGGMRGARGVLMCGFVRRVVFRACLRHGVETGAGLVRGAACLHRPGRLRHATARNRALLLHRLRPVVPRPRRVLRRLRIRRPEPLAQLVPLRGRLRVDRRHGGAPLRRPVAVRRARPGRGRGGARGLLRGPVACGRGGAGVGCLGGVVVRGGAGIPGPRRGVRGRVLRGVRLGGRRGRTHRPRALDALPVPLPTTLPFPILPLIFLPIEPPRPPPPLLLLERPRHLLPRAVRLDQPPPLPALPGGRPLPVLPAGHPAPRPPPRRQLGEHHPRELVQRVGVQEQHRRGARAGRRRVLRLGAGGDKQHRLRDARPRGVGDPHGPARGHAPLPRALPARAEPRAGLVFRVQGDKGGRLPRVRAGGEPRRVQHGVGPAAAGEEVRQRDGGQRGLEHCAEGGVDGGAEHAGGRGPGVPVLAPERGEGEALLGREVVVHQEVEGEQAGALAGADDLADQAAVREGGGEAAEELARVPGDDGVRIWSGGEGELQHGRGFEALGRRGRGAREGERAPRGRRSVEAARRGAREEHDVVGGERKAPRVARRVVEFRNDGRGHVVGEVQPRDPRAGAGTQGGPRGARREQQRDVVQRPRARVELRFGARQRVVPRVGGVGVERDGGKGALGVPRLGEAAGAEQQQADGRRAEEGLQRGRQGRVGAVEGRGVAPGDRGRGLLLLRRGRRGARCRGRAPEVRGERARGGGGRQGGRRGRAGQAGQRARLDHQLAVGGGRRARVGGAD